MARRNTSRRRFLKRAAGAGLAAASFHFFPDTVLGRGGHAAPNDRLHIAGIGVGGMGAANLSQMETERIVALCDVDDAFAAGTFAKYHRAKTYKDYRVMLEQQRNLDAVLIATPDHTHAVIALAAMEAGKHVYCQKPLTHDIHEARVLTEAARRTGVVTQMGNQFHSGEGIRQVCEWIWDGAIGAVREVDAWCSLKYTPFGHTGWSTLLGERPTETPPVPDTLDWDTWIGPAPFRPYHPTYHPTRWRAWWDFGCGMMGDRGVHTLDSVFWALKLAAPTTIEVLHTEGGNAEVHPDVALVRYQFAARGDMPPVTVNWYAGTEPPRPDDLEPGRQMGDSEGGVIFKGETGKIMHGTYAAEITMIPESKLKAYELPPPTIPRVEVSHEQNWVQCCKSGEQASSNFSYAGPLTEFVLLGNVAIRLGGKIEWDPKHIKAKGRPEADEWIRRPYRRGWKL